MNVSLTVKSAFFDNPWTIWHNDNLTPCVKTDNLTLRTIWHREQFDTINCPRCQIVPELREVECSRVECKGGAMQRGVCLVLFSLHFLPSLAGPPIMQCNALWCTPKASVWQIPFVFFWQNRRSAAFGRAFSCTCGVWIRSRQNKVAVLKKFKTSS